MSFTITNTQAPMLSRLAYQGGGDVWQAIKVGDSRVTLRMRVEARALRPRTKVIPDDETIEQPQVYRQVRCSRRTE